MDTTSTTDSMNDCDTTDTLSTLAGDMWGRGCEHFNQLRRRFCSDPLEEEGLTWFSNFCMHMRYVLGAAPGLARCVAHAVVPGVCRDSSRSFFYCYSRESRDMDCNKKSQ